MVKYFLRYLITMVKHAIKIEPIKYLGKYMPFCLILSCAEEAIYTAVCDKITFLYFTLILFRENNPLNSREGVQF